MPPRPIRTSEDGSGTRNEAVPSVWNWKSLRSSGELTGPSEGETAPSSKVWEGLTSVKGVLLLLGAAVSLPAQAAEGSGVDDAGADPRSGGDDDDDDGDGDDDGDDDPKFTWEVMGMAVSPSTRGRHCSMDERYCGTVTVGLGSSFASPPRTPARSRARR